MTKKKTDIDETMERACAPIKRELDNFDILIKSVKSEMNRHYNDNLFTVLAGITSQIALVKLAAYESYICRISK